MRAIFLMALVLVLVLAAPAQAAPERGQRTETPVASTAPDADAIRATYVRQYEPLPASVPAHPEACDWIGYLRFRHREGPADPSRADAVLVAQPGNLAGASHLDIVARNAIAAAAERGRHIELWALDRRSNCIEDRHGIQAAARARDYRVAIDYYFRGREVEGRRFGGFPRSAELPFLAELGLAQTVRDEHAVIVRGIPDAAARRRKVFCGGHSHGGLITAAFSMWDFDGDPRTTDDAGYNQCAGYFALETIVDLDSAGLSSLGPLGNLAGAGTQAATVAAIRSGAVSRNETFVAPLIPENTMLLTLAALAAHQQPDEESQFTRLVPATPDMELTLRLFFSRDAVAFATGQPRDFRLTNEALFGALIDDNSQPLGFIATSVGTFDGGLVAEKTFPLPHSVTSALPATVASTLVSANRLMIPAEPKGPLYTWRSYERVGAPDAPRQVDSQGRPFTSPPSEVVDIHEWARAAFEAPADFVEWYFPTRLLTDTVAAIAGARDGDLAALQHPEGTRARPTITILGGESLGPSYADDPGVLAESPNRFLSLPGYNHADVTGAARLQNGGGPEGASTGLADFVLDTVGAAEPEPAIRLSVEPRRVRAGRRVRLSFRTRSSSSACRAGVTIRFAGRRSRTSRSGRATLRVRLRRAGRVRAVAAKPGCRPGSVAVQVVKGKPR